MSTRNLSSLFRPKSVAVLGAAERDNTVGSLVMRNLLHGGFTGPIMPVNAKLQSVGGVLAYKTVESLPVVPDMAILCTPPNTIAEDIRKLGERGTRAAIVLTGGLATTLDDKGQPLIVKVMEIARSFGMRVLGPNCLGIMVPQIGLNASFAHRTAEPGRIAFVSQSGALCTAVLDWAKPKGIGFSHFISLGDATDVDFGDVMDYLGSDPSTRAILLFIETIRERRNFMSAARAASRNKPVLCIKAGRVAESAKAAVSHTGALAGTDEVYDAALRRAGMLRVYTLDEMFTAVETLARAKPPQGEKLGIITNGGGIGIMAVDELIEMGGSLAELNAPTIEKLNAVLPQNWSHDNPIDLNGDADGDRYVKALDVLFECEEVHSILAMHAPTALTDANEVAEKVIQSAKSHRANIMSCWVGQDQVGQARRMFREAGMPTYETPDQAVHAFMHLVNYRRNQEMLMEMPPSALSDFTPDTAAARTIIKNALNSGNEVLSEPEAKAVLAAYGIPIVETHTAKDPAEASRIAKQMGGQVALKILSHDIAHKSDVGGVMLNLQGPFEVEKAANAMLENVALKFPEARIEGFTVQTMARRPRAQEIIIGVTTDPIFGPVIMFGQGGIAVEVIKDHAIGLPPLNMSLSKELIQRTRVWKLLQGYRDRPPADIDAICLTLMKISQMIIDIPEIIELDINPLFADASGVLALDASIRASASAPTTSDRLAIRPYPKRLEEEWVMRDDRKVLIRPIRPEDEPNHHVFISKLSAEDIRFRFFGLVGELPHSEMARLTQIDYDREMAFVAVLIDEDGNATEDTLGVVRTVTDSDNENAEFAVVVRSDLKRTGLGKKLMLKIIEYSDSRHTAKVVGQVLTDNSRMLKFVEGLGFKRVKYVESDIVEVALDLHARAAAREAAAEVEKAQ